MVVVWAEPKLMASLLLSDKLAHLPESPLAHFSFNVCQLTQSMTSVGEPFTFVHITTRPYKNAESAHISSLPLAIITLDLVELIRAYIISLDYLPCEEPLSMVLALFPLSGIST